MPWPGNETSRTGKSSDLDPQSAARPAAAFWCHQINNRGDGWKHRASSPSAPDSRRRSEESFWNDENIPRKQWEVCRDFAILQQVIQMDTKLFCRAIFHANQRRIVPVGELSNTPSLNDHVQNRHVRTIWNRHWQGRFAHNPNLLREGPDKSAYRDRDQRVLNVVAELLLDLARELRRRLALRIQVLDEGNGNPAIRTDRHGAGELSVSPHEDREAVSGAN